MFKEERRNEILHILENERYSTIEYLASKLYASPSSIRRDVEALQKMGYVKRSYGGVELVSDNGRSLPSFAVHKHKDVEIKKRIAKEAQKLVKDGMVVFLDGSSTCYYLAELLLQRRNITVVTNNLDSANIPVDFETSRVYSTGGLVSSTNKSVLVGSFAEAMARGIHADIFFFSPLSVAKSGVISDDSEEENSLRHVMFENSDKRVLLCHSGKLGYHSIFSFCNMGDIDCAVCDTDLKAWFDKEYENVEFIKA